ncbi:MAG: hypothetical protein WD021_11290 [Rhodothermales bacterium]
MTVRCLIAAVLLFAAPVRAQGVDVADRHFDEGNRLFREGDFEAAVEQYRMAIEAGYGSGSLYYNMGNAYFRMDELGQSIRYYEKAARWLPARTDVAHNLSLARGQISDSFSRVPPPIWRTALERIGQVWSPAALFTVGLLLYLGAAGALAMWIRRGRSAWLRRAAYGLGLPGVCFILLGLTASYDRVHTVRAVMLENRTTLLDRPNGGRTDVQVHEGTVVKVVTQRAAWSEVQLPNGTTGWVLAGTYGTI